MAVAIQSNGTPGVNGTGLTLSITFNNVSGDRVIGMPTICASGATPTVTGVTYPDAGSVAMAKITNTTSGTTDDYASIWEKTSAATGSNTMKATFSTGGGSSCNLGAFSVSGSHASTASTAGTPVATASGTSLEFTKTTTAGNGLCAVFICGDNNLSITDTQVLLQNISNLHSGDNAAGAYQDATGGSDVIKVSSSGSADQMYGCGMEIPAAAGGGGGVVAKYTRGPMFAFDRTSLMTPTVS